MLGPVIATQMRGLRKTLPEAANRLTAHFHFGSMADLIKDGTAASALGGLASRVIAWATTAAGALASLLLVLFGVIYLAINPRLYRDGFVKLVPPATNVEATLDDAGAALKRWLVGIMPSPSSRNARQQTVLQIRSEGSEARGVSQSASDGIGNRTAFKELQSDEGFARDAAHGFNHMQVGNVAPGKRIFAMR